MNTDRLIIFSKDGVIEECYIAKYNYMYKKEDGKGL